MAHLQDLATELILMVLAYLGPSDLASISYMSRRLRDVANPLLWRDIELHPPQFHDPKDLPPDNLGHPTWMEKPRSYLACERFTRRLNEMHGCKLSERRPMHVEVEYQNRTRHFLRIIHMLRTWERDRYEAELAPIIRSVCLTVTSNFPAYSWDVVSSFPTLETLDIIGEYYATDAPKTPKTASELSPRSERPLRQMTGVLRNVKMHGYVPADFVSYICETSRDTITHLDLGVLEPPNGGKEQDLPPRCLDWFPRRWGTIDPQFRLRSLRHLSLCMLAANPANYTDMLDVLYKWTQLVRRANTTLEEFILDVRHIRPQNEIRTGQGIHRPATSSDLNFLLFSLRVFRDDSRTWPNLSRLILRGVVKEGASYDMDRLTELSNHIPHANIEVWPGNYMFIETDSGVVLNWGGSDGLLPDPVASISEEP